MKTLNEDKCSFCLNFLHLYLVEILGFFFNLMLDLVHMIFIVRYSHSRISDLYE